MPRKPAAVSESHGWDNKLFITETVIRRVFQIFVEISFAVP